MSNVLFLSILLIEFSIVSCFSITKEGYYFPALVKTTLLDMDWAGCLTACHKNLECISYNYNREKRMCELNVDGIHDHCAGPSSPIIASKGWIFHQTRHAVVKSDSCAPAAPKCDCNCGSSQQCNVNPQLGDLPVTAAKSCQEIFENRRHATSGAYYIRTDAGKARLIYCKMIRTPGKECGEGGWTLAMKIDGRKSTFLYNANKMWTERNVYQGDCGRDFSETETKLETFFSLRMTEGLCLGMKVNDQTNWLKIKRTGRLLEILHLHSPQPTSINRSQWKSLINGSSMQEDCLPDRAQQGFNVGSENGATNSAKARIGLIGFLKCGETAESRIGFGTGGSAGGMDASNSCGNEASNSVAKERTSIKAFCYILVK